MSTIEQLRETATNEIIESLAFYSDPEKFRDFVSVPVGLLARTKAALESAQKAEQKALGLYLELQESAQASNRYAQAQLESANKRVERLEAAAQLTLDFHSAAEWNEEKRLRWSNLLTVLLGPASTRKSENGYHYKHGDIASTNEATTRNLCNAARAALAAEVLENDEKA